MGEKVCRPYTASQGLSSTQGHRADWPRGWKIFLDSPKFLTVIWEKHRACLWERRSELILKRQHLPAACHVEVTQALGKRELYLLTYPRVNDGNYWEAIGSSARPPDAESQATSRVSFPMGVFKETQEDHQQHPLWHRTSPSSTMSLCQSLNIDWHKDIVQASRQVTYKKQHRTAKGETPTLSSSNLSAKMNLSFPSLAQSSKYILKTNSTPPICKEEKKSHQNNTPNTVFSLWGRNEQHVMCDNIL